MEVASVAIQQAYTQLGVAQNMVKQQVDTEKAVVNLVQQAVSGGDKGRNLDISV